MTDPGLPHRKSLCLTPPPSPLRTAPATLGQTLAAIIALPNMASRRWIWEQYDSMVMADTVAGPGGDAAVVRIHDSQAYLALTTDCTPRYVAADPETGGAQAVAEAWRNLNAVGAKPLAITNNLNFGNPERPGNHGPTGGRGQRFGRGLCGPRHARRLGQCLALQRDQYFNDREQRGHSADPGHWRPRS